MFPFPPDPLHLFDKPLLNHPEANALSFPPSKLDHASPSPLLPLSPLIFDHPELLNDINLHAAPPQISPPPPPPLSSTPDKPSSSRKNTKPSPRSTAFSCDLDKCGAGPAKNVDGGGGAGSRRLRKDRHSKIHTAQGPRDRRMRLSLDVARKFFDLQDTLGFDKASKTVDWLLNSCKSSIMELSGSSSPTHHLALDAAGNGAAKSESSTSECEVISTGTNHAPTAERAKRVTTRRPSRDAATHPPPSRESRQMARARARERTKEKMMLTRRVQFEESGDLKRQPASSLSLFEAGDESGTLTHTTKTSWELATEEGQVSSCSPVQHKKGSTVYPPLAIGGGFAPISVFDYDQRAVHNGDCISFTGEQYWDIRPSDNAEEQRLTFADAQLHQPFLWEAFNPRI